MIKRRKAMLAAGLAATMILMTFSFPAVAGSNLAQAVSAELTLRKLDLPAAYVCFNDECQTIAVPTPDGGDLTLVLTYSVVSSGHLPTLDARAGMPPACEMKRSGQTTRTPGVTLSASGAKFAEGAFLRIRQGARTIATLPDGRASKASTEPMSASLCLVPS